MKNGLHFFNCWESVIGEQQQRTANKQFGKNSRFSCYSTISSIPFNFKLFLISSKKPKNNGFCKQRWIDHNGRVDVSPLNVVNYVEEFHENAIFGRWMNDEMLIGSVYRLVHSLFQMFQKTIFFYPCFHLWSAKLANVAGLEMYIEAVLDKDFYCNISLGNLYIEYTYHYF